MHYSIYIYVLYIFFKIYICYIYTYILYTYININIIKKDCMYTILFRIRYIAKEMVANKEDYLKSL